MEYSQNAKLTHQLSVSNHEFVTKSAAKSQGHLRRLDRTFYQGRAYVHWTMTMQNRSVGWLSQEHHDALGNLLFHTMARFRLACPVYCVMPDHAHFLFIGLDQGADQLKATAWLRREWDALLDPLSLQKQAYDHVLREQDRKRDAFADLVHYILRNPVRNGLVHQWQEWPYSGACFPGYPHLDPRKEFFWENFWKAYLEQS